MNAPSGYTSKGTKSHKAGSGELRRQYALALKEEARKQINQLKNEQMRADQSRKNQIARDLSKQQANLERFDQQMREFDEEERTLSELERREYMNAMINEAAKYVSKKGAFSSRRNRTRKIKRTRFA